MFPDSHCFTATKKFIEVGNKSHVNALQNKNATPAQKQAAYTALVGFIATEMGVTPTVAKVMVDNQYKGFYSEENGNIYIADNLHGNSLESAKTLGHETSHLVDYQNDKDITKTGNYSSNRENYADIMGDATGDYLNYQYSSNGYSALDSIINNKNGVATSGTTQDALLTHNSKEFYGLDKDKGDPSIWRAGVLLHKVAKKLHKVPKGKLTGAKFKKILKDEGVEIMDDLMTLLDGELSVDDALAVLDLIAGTDTNSKKSVLTKKVAQKLKDDKKSGKLSAIVKVKQADVPRGYKNINGKIVGPKGGVYKSTGKVDKDGHEIFRHEHANGKDGGYIAFKNGKQEPSKSPHPTGHEVHHQIPKSVAKRVQEKLDKYGLSIEGDWNKVSMPHRGSHPKKYDAWVVTQVNKVDKIVESKGGGAEMFKKEFKKYVTDELAKTPDRINKSFWM